MSLTATDAQIRYIGILFTECGYNLAQKKSYLLRRFNVSFTDELSLENASKVIGDLKEQKVAKQEKEKGSNSYFNEEGEE